MRDFPNFASRGLEAKQDPPSAPEDGAPKRNLFFALRARGSNPDDYDHVSNFMYFSLYVL